MSRLKSERELVRHMIDVLEIDVDTRTREFMEEHFEEYFGGTSLDEIRNLMIWKINAIREDAKN